jgi:hypothetical protein
VSLLLSTSIRAEVIDRVLAVVANHAILESDVRAVRELRLMVVPPQGDPVRAVLSALIDRRLMLAEVERYSPPEPSLAAIDRELQAIRDRFASAEPYQAALARAGITEAHLRGRVRDDLRMSTYLDQRFTLLPPTEEAVQAYYRDNAARFIVGGRAIPLEDARAVIADEVARIDRQLRLEQWVAGLRQRTQISDRYGGME